MQDVERKHGLKFLYRRSKIVVSSPDNATLSSKRGHRPNLAIQLIAKQTLGRSPHNQQPELVLRIVGVTTVTRSYRRT